MMKLKNAILIEKIPLKIAIKMITSNPADILKLNNKGRIQKGKDADITILNKDDLTIDTVIAMGKVMVRNGQIAGIWHLRE